MCLLNVFYEYISAKKSLNTAKSYFQDLQTSLPIILKDREISDLSLQSVTQGDIFDWLKIRSQKNYTPASTKRAISSLKAFAKFMLISRKIHLPVLMNITSPKLPQKLPRAGTQDQLDAIKRVIEKEIMPNVNKDKKWLVKRDYAIFIFIYCTGLRISEVLSVTPKQMKESFITVTGKGNKQRIIPIIPLVAKSVNEYVKSCPFPIKKDGLLFVNSRGEPHGARGFQKFIEKLRGHIGLEQNFTPHSLRHSFATHMMENGADIKIIEEILGHASLSTTQKYLKVTSQSLKDNYNKYFS